MKYKNIFISKLRNGILAIRLFAILNIISLLFFVF